jgi:hypothetical protein
VGDRLDDVLGEAAASAYLLELLRISSMVLRQQQPVSLVADEAHLLLARVLRQRTFEFDLLAEHAAYTHALAEGLCDALENPGDAAQTQAQVLRAKNWERQADHLLMDARQRAERRARWLPVVDCLGKADDVADALEEATFMHSLTLIHPAPRAARRSARSAESAGGHHAGRHPGPGQGHRDRPPGQPARRRPR